MKKNKSHNYHSHATLQDKNETQFATLLITVVTLTFSLTGLLFSYWGVKTMSEIEDFVSRSIQEHYKKEKDKLETELVNLKQESEKQLRLNFFVQTIISNIQLEKIKEEEKALGSEIKKLKEDIKELKFHKQVVSVGTTITEGGTISADKGMEKLFRLPPRSSFTSTVEKLKQPLKELNYAQLDTNLNQFKLLVIKKQSAEQYISATDFEYIIDQFSQQIQSLEVSKNQNKKIIKKINAQITRQIAIINQLLANQEDVREQYHKNLKNLNSQFLLNTEQYPQAILEYTKNFTQNPTLINLTNLLIAKHFQYDVLIEKFSINNSGTEKYSEQKKIEESVKSYIEILLKVKSSDYDENFSKINKQARIETYKTIDNNKLNHFRKYVAQVIKDIENKKNTEILTDE